MLTLLLLLTICVLLFSFYPEIIFPPSFGEKCVLFPILFFLSDHLEKIPAHIQCWGTLHSPGH